MTQIKTNLTSYSEHRPEDGVKDNWAAAFAKREVEEHKTAPVLDHPDGCVTAEKLSDEVKEHIEQAFRMAESATEKAYDAKDVAQSAKASADIAVKESENAYEKSLDAHEKASTAENIANTAKNKSETAEQRAISAETKADAAVVTAEEALRKSEDASNDVENHSKDAEVHITFAERRAWNLASIEADEAKTMTGENSLKLSLLEESIPSKVSQLENDAKYVTKETLTETTLIAGEAFTKAEEAKQIAISNADNKADKSELPQKVSELENDAEYVTEDGLKDTVISFDGCVEEGYYSDNEVDNIIEEGVYKLCDRFLSTRLSAILVVSYSPAASTLPDGSIVYTSIHQTLIDQNGVSKRDFNIDENKWGSWVHAYEEIKKKVSKEELQEELEWKVDRPYIVQNSASGGSGVYRFENNYNKEYRWGQRDGISFYFGNDGYEEDYISGLSFDSGATPTRVDYAIPEEPTQISVINWVGTDCAPDSYINDKGETVPISKFQPSANTHYDIVFYFNGTQFIGLVNGYVPAGGNEAV